MEHLEVVNDTTPTSFYFLGFQVAEDGRVDVVVKEWTSHGQCIVFSLDDRDLKLLCKQAQAARRISRARST